MLPRRSFADWLVAWRWPLLGLSLALAAAAYVPARSLSFERSIESMFAAHDPRLPPYHRLKETFGGNEVVLAVYRDEDLLAPDGRGLQRLAVLSGDLRGIPGVQDTLSLAEVNRAVEKIDSLGRFGWPFTRRRETPVLVDPENELAARYRELFRRYTHSDDGRVAAVVCLLDPHAAAPRGETIAALRLRIEQEQGGMLAGEPVMVADGFAYLEADGVRLGLWSSLLVGLVILVSFRSLRWVLAPLAVVQIALLWTQAGLHLSGLRLSMVSSMLTAIVTVVGVAAAVHGIVCFREARRRGLPPPQAMSQTIAALAAPVLWSCLTDALGFLSLLACRVGPVQDFGVMSAAGCLCVLLALALAGPGLALAGRLDSDPRTAWGEGRLGGLLDGLVRWTGRHPWPVGIGAAVVLGLGAWGMLRLRVETDFTRNFQPGSPVVRSYEFVETELGGAGVWDVILPAPAELTDDYLDRVRKLEARLRAIPAEGAASSPALTCVLSLADADAAACESLILKQAGPEARALGMAEAMPAFTAALRTPQPAADGRHYFRIMLRARERQPAEAKVRLIAEVRRICDAEAPEMREAAGWGAAPGGEGEAGPAPAIEVTGFFVLLTGLVDSLLADQWRAFAVAAVGLLVMLAAAFRDLRLAAVALVPNVLPIFLVLGTLGWLGIPANMGVAMISAVSLGLSIDSSIHYLIAYQRARAAGKPREEALRDVQQTVGRAMVFATLALAAGFGALCVSRFTPTVYFGGLAALSMLGGLAGNLVLLPLLVRAVGGKERAAAPTQSAQVGARP